MKALKLLPLLLALSTPLQAAERVALDYHVRFLPAEGQAEVSLELERGEAVQELDFNLGDEQIFSAFAADGQWLEENGRGKWQPAPGKARLSWRVRVDHAKGSRFDARMTDDWVIMRGDDLIPPASTQILPGYRLRSQLHFSLPKGWKSVETGWPRIADNSFRVDNPARQFDRPTGWLVAGKLGVRRASFGDTDLTIAAPIGEGARRMDIMTLLTFVIPQYQDVFPRVPRKVLIVSAGNPMWRGGLSAPNSLFMHADRPLVSENGTSSLLHEMVHVYSGIRDSERSDWISEGVAEFYAIELLRRAGGMTEARYMKVREDLQEWGSKVRSLRTERSSGELTARAVILLQDLDEEIRKASDNQRSLDNVVQGLVRLDRVSTDDFIQISENVLGKRSKVLSTRLLR